MKQVKYPAGARSGNGRRFRRSMAKYANESLSMARLKFLFWLFTSTIMVGLAVFIIQIVTA